jgi:rhodanese-related sulfurtransferase
VRRTLLRDAGLFAAVALVIGTVANLLPSRHIPWWGKGLEPPQTGVDYALLDPLSVDALRTSLPKVVILDTRSPEQWLAGHIPGARTIAFTELGRDLNAARVAELRRADAIVICGGSSEADVEQLLGQQLVQRGLPRPYVLLGGFGSWQAAGLPTEGGQ